MTDETSGRPIAVIGSTGCVTVATGETPTDGRVTLRIHGGTAQAVAFLSRALTAANELKVVSVAPIAGDSTDVVLNLRTTEQATSFLDQLKVVFETAEGRVVAARARAVTSTSSTLPTHPTVSSAD